MMWYIKRMGYYLAMKNNKITPPAVQWMDLEIIILSGVSQTQKKNITRLLICVIFKNKKVQMNLTCKAEAESQMQKTNSGGGRGVK